jgi:SpoVK/Ycf46/Vps4 family AAA+-type ATPase
MNDILDFVIDTYGNKIKKYLELEDGYGEHDITISFFADSEDLVDSIISEKENMLTYSDFAVKIIQDYSINEKDGEPLSDLSYCKVNEYKFVKVVTPFTKERAYDFLIGKTEDMPKILRILKERETKKNFRYNDKAPVIGFDFKEIESETIKFLMNEDFREYCASKFIKLKRGIILEGKPGTGKTLTLQWLRNQAEKNKISYRQFKTVKEFMESIDEYYGEGKKIFVFEDFDAALMERKETGEAPNQILASVLNTLEGVEEINDVVSIFTTNNIDVFDKAFIRPGRIDRVFRYNLPSKEEFLSFFKAYIPEEKEYFDVMVEHLSFLSADVSYAILKGICDDINIFKFSGKSLTEKELFDIIKQKVTGANKDKTVTNTSKYVL